MAENPEVNPSGILTPEELAKRLKVPRGWISEKVRTRKQGSTARLPHFKVGKYLRFYWPDVSAWLMSTRQGAKARA